MDGNPVLIEVEFIFIVHGKRTPFLKACRNANLGVVKLVVEEYKVDITKTDDARPIETERFDQISIYYPSIQNYSFQQTMTVILFLTYLMIQVLSN